MSYSRWLGSRWYTFWCSTESNKRNDQLFSVDCRHEFTYAELKKDIEACLDVVEAWCSETHEELWGGLIGVPETPVVISPHPVTRPDRDELRHYMLHFMSDVEEEYDEETDVDGGASDDDGLRSSERPDESKIDAEAETKEYPAVSGDDAEA